MAEGFKNGIACEDEVTEEQTVVESGISVQVSEKEYPPSRDKNTNVSYYNETI